MAHHHLHQWHEAIGVELGTVEPGITKTINSLPTLADYCDC